MSLEVWNIHIFNAINSLAGKNPYLDAFMIFSAQYIVFIVPIVILYLWFSKRGDKNFSLFLLISVILAAIVSMSISVVYYHPRPFAMGLGTTLIHHPTDSSFPSDHTTVMFAFSLPFLFFRKYKSGTVFVILASLVGYARVFCGVHFPLDIIGGFLVALLVTFILYAVREAVFRCTSKIVGWWNRRFDR